MLEIRRPDESDRARIVDLMRISFNVPPAWARLIAPEMKLERFRAAYEDGSLVAITQNWALRQWFGGRALPMAGIGAVASAPERRGAGLAPRVMRAVLEEARGGGALLSTLYPSRALFYRRLGYEYAGLLTQHRIRIADLAPAEGESTDQEYADGDLDAVRACYGRFAARHGGTVESADEDWWRLRVLRRWNPDVTTRAVVVRGSGGVEGYAAFQLDPQQDTWGYRITCSHLVATTPAATMALLEYFRGFRGVGQTLAWYGPPGESMSVLFAGGAETVQPVRTLRFMTRILDVPPALEARGYPQVTGAATIAVRDELFAAHAGPFRIIAEGGRVRVSRAVAGGRRPIPVGILSALFTGFASPAEFVHLGLLDEDDPALGLLGALFAGAVPWMTDFF